MSSARDPCPAPTASSSIRCWCCATRRTSCSRVNVACDASRALGEANGSATAFAIALASASLFARATSAAVVLVVQLDEPLEDRRLLADDGVELLGDGGKVGQLGRGLEPLGGEPRGRSLEDAPQLDRIGDVVQREGAHDEPAAGERPEQPLVGERRERQPERCARDAEPLGEIDLGDALVRRQLAREDELAQAERRLGRLRAGYIATRHADTLLHAFRRR